MYWPQRDQSNPNPVEQGATHLATATATSIVPLGDKVVVKAIEREGVTKSGLVLPDNAKERPQEGELIAVGPGRMTDEGTRIPLDLKKGDRILFAKYSGMEIKVDEEDYLILREADILAKLS